MKIAINEKLTVTVTDNDGVVWNEDIKLSDFQNDEWHEFEHGDKEYEVNTFVNSEQEFVAHLYPYGDTETPNSVIDSNSVSGIKVQSAGRTARQTLC